MPVVGLLNHTVAVCLFVIGLLSGGLSIMREVQLMYWPAKTTEKRAFWGWVRIAFVVAAVLLWVDEHAKVGQLQANALVVSLNCDRTFSAIPFPPDGKLHLLITTMQGGGLVVLSPGIGQDRYPPSESPLPPTYQCSVVNYGTVPIFSVEANFEALTKEMVRHGDVYQTGKTLATYPHEVSIPEVNGNGGKFVFYVQNTSDQFVQVGLPEYATLELASEIGRRQKIRLRRSGLPDPFTMHLNPVKFPSPAGKP